MLDMLKAIFKETCEQLDCELLEFGGEHDHVHLMVSAHPKIALSNLIGKLKGQIKPKLWGNHFWSPSYCVVSVGGASLDVIKQYIENQRKPPSEKQINQSKKYRLKADGWRGLKQLFNAKANTSMMLLEKAEHLLQGARYRPWLRASALFTHHLGFHRIGIMTGWE
jgi:putative transposase